MRKKEFSIEGHDFELTAELRSRKLVSKNVVGIHPNAAKFEHRVVLSCKAENYSIEEYCFSERLESVIKKMVGKTAPMWVKNYELTGGDNSPENLTLTKLGFDE